MHHSKAASPVPVTFLSLLAPLVTGYRTFDELASVYHDVSADGSGRSLAGVLFPKMQAFLYTMY